MGRVITLEVLRRRVGVEAEALAERRLLDPCRPVVVGLVKVVLVERPEQRQLDRGPERNDALEGDVVGAEMFEGQIAVRIDVLPGKEELGPAQLVDLAALNQAAEKIGVVAPGGGENLAAEGGAGRSGRRTGRRRR